MASNDGWSELSADILSIILEKLLFSDCIRFGSVCQHWNNLFKCSEKYRRRHVPWLLQQHGTYDTVNLFSLDEDTTYNIPIPKPKKIPYLNPDFMYCFGVSEDWLIVADSKYNVQLVQPLTGKQIGLPEITTIPFITYDDGLYQGIESDCRSNRFRPEKWRGCPQDMRKYFVKAALLSPDTVMMIHELGEGLSFARVGGNTWTVLETGFIKEDVIVHDGKFHTMTPRGAVEVWEPDGYSFTRRCIVPEIPDWGSPKMVKFQKDNPHFFIGVFNLDKLDRKYLVESANGEHLMAVFRIQNFCIFKVLLLNKKTRKWMHVETLGEQIIFLGRKHSICHHAATFPELQPNCIYYADNGDSGIFRMVDITKQPLYLPQNNQSDYNLSNLWFTSKRCNDKVIG